MCIINLLIMQSKSMCSSSRWHACLIFSIYFPATFGLYITINIELGITDKSTAGIEVNKPLGYFFMRLGKNVDSTPYVNVECMWNTCVEWEAFVLDKRAAEVTFYSIDALAHTHTYTHTRTACCARFLAKFILQKRKSQSELSPADCGLQFASVLWPLSTRLRSCQSSRSRLSIPAVLAVCRTGCFGFCFLLTDVQPHCQFVS